MDVSATRPEGYELTKEVFRWDQRLFTILMRLPGLGEKASVVERANGLGNNYILGDEVVASLCEATGGKKHISNIRNIKSVLCTCSSAPC
jgi:hypothetical protein